VGDAASPADLDTWAALPRDAATLLAGAADFFAALLRARGHRLAPLSPAASRLAGPTLILSGTTHPGSAASRSGGRHVAARPAGYPLDIPAWADEIRLRLKQDQVALACFAGPISTDPALPPRLRTALAEIAVTLAAERSFTHLIVEGGATAAAITQALDWRELRLQHAWAPGVASLRPTAAPDFTLTLKPGSYPWPAALSPLSP
jgi:uncharacterized protein YgbK (DUF1537 family)